MIYKGFIFDQHLGYKSRLLFKKSNKRLGKKKKTSLSVVAEMMNGTQGSNTSNGSAIPSAFTLDTYFISGLYFVIALISVFGNILVMLAVYTNRRLQTTSNYLLVALAVTDFFQGAVSLPLRLVEVLKADCDHHFFCRTSIHVSTLFGGASNLHILLIAIERFISICWPYFYCSWITTKCTLLGVGVAWLSMFIFSFLPTMGWGAREPENSVTFCRFPAFLTQDYISCLFVFVYVLPIISVTFLNVFILRASLDHARRIGAQVAASNYSSKPEGNFEFDPERIEEVRRRKAEATKQRKATRIVAAVVGSFIVLVVPIMIVDIVEMLTDAVVPVPVVKTTVLMIYANHCVNVFVYAGFNSYFRNTFKKIVLKGIHFVRGRGRNEVQCVNSLERVSTEVQG